MRVNDVNDGHCSRGEPTTARRRLTPDADCPARRTPCRLLSLRCPKPRSTSCILHQTLQASLPAHSLLSLQRNGRQPPAWRQWSACAGGGRGWCVVQLWCPREVTTRLQQDRRGRVYTRTTLLSLLCGNDTGDGHLARSLFAERARTCPYSGEVWYRSFKKAHTAGFRTSRWHGCTRSAAAQRRESPGATLLMVAQAPLPGRDQQLDQEEPRSPPALLHPGLYNPRPISPAPARIVLTPAVDEDGTPRVSARVEVQVRQGQTAPRVCRT
jgi:hypothetical protein